MCFGNTRAGFDSLHPDSALKTEKFWIKSKKVIIICRSLAGLPAEALAKAGLVYR